MTRTHTLRLLSVAALGALFSASPYAQQEGGYYYGGGSIGQSRANIDAGNVTARQFGPGVSANDTSSDDRDKAFKLFGGYQINRHFGVEAGYFNLGKFGISANTTPPGTLNGEIKSQGLNLDLVGTLPFTSRLSGLARVGAIYAQTKASFSGTGAATPNDANPSSNGTNYKVGLGLQYAVTPSFWLRTEIERHRIDATPGNHANVDVVSVGVVFPFGRDDSPVARPVAAAPYVAPAPVVMAAAPPPPAVVAPRRSVKISAETLFTFDKADLRPEGKAALDTFAQDLKGSRYDVVNVVGHADRLGSTAYNQTLSTQRAEVVKSYLVSSGGLDGAKVSAVGKSEAEPVTLPDTCKGDKPTARLIACLQPDRGVEIEVTGSR
jgi:OOP family OmpA-OmpF porin